MPDSMETSYNQWVGRKETSLRRRTLDCGHPNLGEVHYHYWCDRLSCSPACAEAEHDCGLFKGKSSSEGEAVEPEAVVDPPTPRPLTLSPETYRALYGPSTPDHDGAIRIVDPVQPGHMVTLDNSSATFTPQRFVRVLVEGEEIYQGPVEPWTAATAPLVDEPEEPAPFVLRRRNPEDRQAYLAEQRAERVAAGASAEWLETFDALAAAPPVDAAPEPNPDETVTWDVHRRLSAECSAYDPLHSACAGDAVDLLSACLCACHQPERLPWWRRMFPGGTR